MATAVRRGGAIIVNATAAVIGGAPRDLSDTTISAEARFDGSTARVTGRATITDPAAGEFSVRFDAPSYRVGTLLLDVEYAELGVVNSGPTIEIEVTESAVEARLDKVRTQYRESPNLLQTMRSILAPLDSVAGAAGGYGDHWRLSRAGGDQLTVIGHRLGWPRCHCVCDPSPVHGFDCGDGTTVAGMCEVNATWAGCDEGGVSEFCITDDETYRTFLRVRIMQSLGMLDLETLTSAVRMIWPSAWLPTTANGEVIIAPMVEDIDVTDPLLQLWPRVLPIAVGIRTFYHFGTRPIAGFGAGWSGATDCAETDIIVGENGEAILSEGGDTLAAEFPAIEGVADWLCRIDPNPC